MPQTGSSATTDIVLGITGASGAVYATRLLEILLRTGRRVHLTISPAGVEVLKTELGLAVDLENSTPRQLGLPAERVEPGTLAYHHYRDYSAPIASGSFLTAGMVICPCSMGTLASVANGLSTNLIQRAADVHLKERRKLIVVPRETPLGSIALENMKRLSDAGAVVLAAMPGFYHQPKSIGDLVDFVVGRILDQLGVEKNLIPRWGDQPASKHDSARSGEEPQRTQRTPRHVSRDRIESTCCRFSCPSWLQFLLSQGGCIVQAEMARFLDFGGAIRSDVSLARYFCAVPAEEP